MKKLLLLSLLMSSMAFASTTSPTNEDIMNIEVNVIEPVTVEVNDHLIFNNVLAGQEIKSSRGSFTVMGTKGTTYTAKIKELGDETSGTVQLTGENETTLPMVISFNNKGEITNGKAWYQHKVTGHIKVPKDQLAGSYKGNLTISVMHD